jgi:hypothetical protein
MEPGDAMPVSATAGAQTYNGAVSSSGVAATSTAPAGTQTSTGITSPGSVASTSSTPTGVQTHQGSVAAGAVALAGSTPVGELGSVTYEGAVTGGSVAVLADSIAGEYTPPSTPLGGGRARFSWADYLSLISADQPVASNDDEDAIVLAACLVAVLETT